MNISIAKLNKFNDLVSISSRRRPKIILNPEERALEKLEEGDLENLKDNIIYDTAKWKIPYADQVFIEKLSKDNLLSDEDKILCVYNKLCKKYTYDDNLLSYIQKVDDEKFALPDWYGRDIDSDWEKNREKHNRRVCYEVSRYLAKSLIELFKDKEDFNICILWDKDLTHYFVGLTCDKYSLTLDLDDFNNIKDLTRVKTGLTIKGINILNDDEGKFGNALEKFNEGRSEHAIKRIESEIKSSTVNEEEEESNDIIFLKYAIEILKEKYDIDSQGLFEYMKEIVDIKLGPESRQKVWKKLEENSNEETRYIRCLMLNVENKKYLIDVDQKTLRQFDEKELTEKNAVFIPYKELDRNWRT